MLTPNFTSVDLTLSLDDFSKCILSPATSVLTNIEADALSMYKDVGQSVWNGGAAAIYNKALGRSYPAATCAGPANNRTALMDSTGPAL